MMKLLEMHKTIIDNWSKQDGTDEKDLADSLHQFNIAIVKKMDLLCGVSNANYMPCKECDYTKNIEFEKIDGSFCSDCGYIYPF